MPEQRGLFVEEGFGIKLLETLQSCVILVRANHSIAPYTERIPRPLRPFYLNKFYTIFQVFPTKIGLNMIKYFLKLTFLYALRIIVQ